MTWPLALAAAAPAIWLAVTWSAAIYRAAARGRRAIAEQAAYDAQFAEIIAHLDQRHLP